jgi:MFS superfamily sulfate permease-like transporter
VAPGIFAAPGIVAYRFEANLFYANAHRFTEEVLRLVTDQPSPVEALVIDASGVDDIDYSAAKALLQLRRQLHARGIRTALVTPSTSLVKELRRFGLDTAGIGDNLVIAATVKKAIHALADQSR